MAFFPGLPRSAGTRKVKPIWSLLKQKTVSGSGIRWAICKSAAHYFCNPSNLDGRVYVYVFIWLGLGLGLALGLGLGLVLRLGLGLRLGLAMICSGHSHLCLTGCRNSAPKSAPRSIQITTPATHCSLFIQAGCSSCRPTNSVKALKVNILINQ